MRQRAKEKQWDEKVTSTLTRIDEAATYEPTGQNIRCNNNYLDLFLDLPWGEFSENQFDLKRAQRF